MPHDSKGRKLEAGDLVTMRFRVEAITSAGEDACNVQLAAINPGDTTEYLPTVSCNARLVEKAEAREPATAGA